MSNGRARYGSIFSGAVLILVGVLLLAHSYHPELEMWGAFSRWWPLLLIFWGAVKLYERMAAKRAGGVASGNVTGGEVFLVVGLLVLLAIVGGSDWIRTHRNLEDFSDIGFLRGTPYSFTEEITPRTISAVSHISITLGRGDISVFPEDVAEIRAVVKKTVYAGNQAEAQSAGGRVHVSLVDSGNGNFEIRPKEDAGGNRVEVTLEVHVPKQASVSARTDRGDVHISGAQGSVSVLARNGDIDVRNSGNDVSVISTHGDIHIVGASGNVNITGRGSEVEIADIKGQVALEGDFFGPVKMNHVDKGVRYRSRQTDLTLTQLSGQLDAGSGRVDLSDSNGDVTLATRKSDVKIANASGRVQITDDGGDIELEFSQPPRADISVESRSGDLLLSLPGQSSFQLDAQTQNGDLDCDFPGLKNPSGRDNDDHSLAGQVGSRGPTIHLRTQHGDIRISKKGL
jgi:DUF4097 and DUF4098 domain-containing protein YvlB